MNFLIQHIVFFVFATIAIISSLLVVTSRNPVRGVLCLVLTFVASAVLWILLHAAFLGLILVLVYVGAVMTLFLFVVMMLDIDIVPQQQGFVRYLPLGILIMSILVGVMIWALSPQHFHFIQTSQIATVDDNNVAAVGNLLFTDYLYAFELAGVLLLVAMISAISLAFRGRRPNSKGQRVHEQVKIRRADRVRLVNIVSEPKSPKSDNE
ncbi:MAG: NADH-quinone oxidoreductase subunit J [Legionellales bacterium]|nr:NADH-quinone oxidoreductase subunit J [Legionellales bacterium]